MQFLTSYKRGLRLLSVATAVAVLAPPAISRQEGAGANPQLQQKVAALKQALAQNKQAMQQYAWVETTLISLKGEVKSQKRSSCHYGPDGKVEKTPMDSGRGQGQQSKGRKSKMVQKKVAEKKEEMSEYMQRAASLIHRYVPPDAATIQEAFQGGKASIQPAAEGVVTLMFRDYAKPGDTYSITLNGASNKILGVKVNSYLDDAKDTVNLNVRFEELPDGANHVAETVLDAAAKQIQVRTLNAEYRKL